MKPKPVSRREFLNHSAVTIGGLAAGTMLIPTKAPAATNGKKYVAGIMGCGGRCQGLLKDCLAAWPGVEFAYACDVDPQRAAGAAEIIEKLSGKKPKVVGDFRRILDDKDVQVFFNFTPDHWHALPTILACQAGKDVYVEKPASHDVWESHQMVEAARKYKRIVQIGTQTRSGRYTQEAIEYIRSGKLGKVNFAHVVNMKKREPIGHKENCPPPEGVDYDMWLGPAPKRPFNPNRFHYCWHWWWDYAGGDITNDGVHQLDIARALIGKDYPKTVCAAGGNLNFDDDQETPDTQIVTWEFDGVTMVCEMLLWTPYMKKTPFELREKLDYYPNWPFDGMRIEVYGDKGLMYFERHGGGWQVYDESEKVISESNDVQPHHKHLENFFECIESRKRPNADIEEGHRSTLLCHIGNISYRLGGRKLTFDDKTETFVNDPEANKYLKRQARDPWVIPEKV